MRFFQFTWLMLSGVERKTNAYWIVRESNALATCIKLCIHLAIYLIAFHILLVCMQEVLFAFKYYKDRVRLYSAINQYIQYMHSSSFHTSFLSMTSMTWIVCYKRTSLLFSWIRNAKSLSLSLSISCVLIRTSQRNCNYNK